METLSSKLNQSLGFQDRLVLKSTVNGSGLFALENFRLGESVVSFRPSFLAAPTRMTIQIAEGRHLVTDGNLGAFVNHACEPNCVFDVTRLAFVAAKPITVGDEITFNYLTTESEMSSPFDCRCGSSKCYGLIRGYHFLPTQSPEVAIR